MERLLRFGRNDRWKDFSASVEMTDGKISPLRILFGRNDKAYLVRPCLGGRFGFTVASRSRFLISF